MSAVPVPNSRRGYNVRHTGDLFAVPTMTVETPAARHTDPETSHIAAEEVTASGLRGHQQRQVAEAVRQWPGSTSAELAQYMCAERVMPARRLPELELAGSVERGEPRRCTVKGRLSLTWWPTSSRREAARCAEANGGAVGVPPSPIPQGERTDAGSGPACQHSSHGERQ